MGWLFIILLIIGLIIGFYITLIFIDRDKIYQRWNDCLSSIWEYQNKADRAFHNIPSLQNGWICQNEYVRSMHRSIFLRHDDLRYKVEEYFKAMLECAEENFPTKQEYPPKGGLRYLPFIINRDVTSLVETFGLTNFKTAAINFGLLILEPGTITPWRQSRTKGTYRYHYALRLPQDGEFGLYLQFDEEESRIHHVKWKEKQGFIWDATYHHQLANRSIETCFLLVADVPRWLSWKYHWINILLHTCFPPERSLDL